MAFPFGMEYSATMPVVTHVVRTPKRRTFHDKDGRICIAKRYDEVYLLTLDWTDELADDSDSISSSSWSADGPTTSGEGTSGDTAYIEVGPGTGTVENTIETTNGYTYQREVRFIGTDVSDNDVDYPTE